MDVGNVGVTETSVLRKPPKGIQIKTHITFFVILMRSYLSSSSTKQFLALRH